MRYLKVTRWLAVLFAIALATACSFKQEADAKFGDQHFKTTIALVELYKLRHGRYPETLQDLNFTGDWDAIALNSVTYHRIGDGYELDIARGWVGQPTLSYPPEFWKGLGLVASNVGGAPKTSQP